MSPAAADVNDAGAPGDAAAKGGERTLLGVGAPLLLVAVLAGLWFGGILPPLLGMGRPGAHGEGHAAEAGEAKQKGPSFVEVPEIVANLNAGARKTMYVKLQVRLELAKAEDEAAVKATMP